MESGAQSAATALSVLCALVGLILALIVEPRRARRMPGTRPYRWGLFQGYSAMTFGGLALLRAVGAALGASDGQPVLGLLGFGALYAIPGFFVTRRVKWAWVALSFLAFNPVSWVINWIYGRNRWNEFRGSAAS